MYSITQAAVHCVGMCKHPLNGNIDEILLAQFLPARQAPARAGQYLLGMVFLVGVIFGTPCIRLRKGVAILKFRTVLISPPNLVEHLRRWA